MPRGLVSTQSVIDQSSYQGTTNVGVGQFSTGSQKRYRGQVFIPTQAAMNSVGFWLQDVGLGHDLDVFLTNVDQGTLLPAGSTLQKWTIPGASLSVGKFAVYSLSPVYSALTPSTKYAVYFGPSLGGTYSDDYRGVMMQNSNVYTGGIEITNTNGTWTTENLTFWFSIGYPATRPKVV